MTVPEPMRLLFLSHVPDNPDGGASRVFHLLTASLRERGHHVDLHHLDDIALPGDPRVRKLLQRTVMPQLLSRFGAGLEPESYDVVMSSSGMAYPLHRRLRRAPGARPALVNLPFGLTVFDHLAGLAEAELGHHRAGAANRIVTGPFQVRWDREGLRAADATVVLNLRDLGTAREVLGPQRDRVSMIPGAVHPDLLTASLHAPPPASRPAAHVLWFATWEARKGAYYVPAAFRRLRENHPGATLTVGGTGRAPTEILASFDPRDRTAVTVLPRISRAEHAQLLCSASIFLFPSLSEGFGLALPEAMAFGCAAVTSSTGFGGDHLSDGVDARVVAVSAEHVGRALVELTGDDQARHRIALAGQALARTFTAERMAAAFEAVFVREVQARRPVGNPA